MAGSAQRTAFVFAGGGSLGAIQVGALRELVNAGERPDFLVGASVGALNACFFAGRPDAAGVAALDAVWRGLSRRDVFPVTFGGATDWLRGGSSLFQPHRLRRLVERHLPIRNLEDAAIPVHVVATNFSGAPVCLSRGLAADAVLASSAIPIAFPSVLIGGDHLMDGAVAGNTPILTAAELGATRIVALQTGYACSMDGPPSGAIARGLHALTLMIASQMERDLKLLAGKVEVYVTPHLCPLDVSPFTFDRSADLIERSANATRLWLKAGGLSHAATPAVFDHDHAGMLMTGRAMAGGYDLVSFLAPLGAPLPGVAEFAAEHAGGVYLFANGANRDLFLAAPERYLPQYGGRCAYAMAQNTDAPGDPRVYRVVGGRLYFNLNGAVHRKWERDIAQHVRRADGYWLARTQSPKAEA